MTGMILSFILSNFFLKNLTKLRIRKVTQVVSID